MTLSPSLSGTGFEIRLPALRSGATSTKVSPNLGTEVSPKDIGAEPDGFGLDYILL